jgi:hypothetical protein
MPPLPIIADVFKVGFHWSHSNGQTAYNVMHFHTSILTASGLEALLNTSWSGSMILECSLAAKIDRLDITKLDGSSATVAFTETNARWSGGSTDAIIPAAAQVVSFRTGLRGRSNRGRIYLPFMVESNFAAGSVSGASNATIQNAWNSFVTGMAAGTAPLCVASYLHANSHDVTSAIVEFTCGTQRRRQSRLR